MNIKRKDEAVLPLSGSLAVRAFLQTHSEKKTRKKTKNRVCGEDSRIKRVLYTFRGMCSVVRTNRGHKNEKQPSETKCKLYTFSFGSECHYKWLFLKFTLWRIYTDYHTRPASFVSRALRRFFCLLRHQPRIVCDSKDRNRIRRRNSR